MRKRQSDRDRKQIRIISEAIDDDPQMLGHRTNPGQHPIDQLIQFTQQNKIKWSWNDNKFIRAMRDTYHNAGKPVPSSKEELVRDLQKESAQDPKLLDKLVSALGGMSRRHFMGLTGAGAAGVATGAIDFSAPEKGQIDKTLKPGGHYKVTYRNFQNQTRVWKDLIFDTTNGSMYWFMDPNAPKSHTSRGGSLLGDPINRLKSPTKAEEIEWVKKRLAWRQAQLDGKEPYKAGRKAHRSWRGVVVPAVPDKYVKSNWPKTIAKLKRQIEFAKREIMRLQQGGSTYGGKKRPYRYITLQVESVVDVLPLGSK